MPPSAEARTTAAPRATTPPAAVPTAQATPPHVSKARLARFDRTERLVHWSTALAVASLAATGAALYVPALSVAFGRRLLFEDAHIYVGLVVFVPVLIGALGTWGRRLRADLRQMNWMTDQELTWLRTLGRRGKASIGKFNPGQKLSTSAVKGLLGVLFITGLIMRWGNFLPVWLRTGATFVHDVFAVMLVALITGHVVFALAHPVALRGMLRGWVPEGWVRRHAPAWDVVQPKQGEI